MATIADVVTNLQNVGIFQFFLPFIILFAIFYGMLTKTKIFGNPKEDPGVNKINAIISFAAAAFIMIYPTTSATVFDLTDYLASFIGGSLIYLLGILVALIVFYMIATPLSGGETKPFARAGTVAAIIAVVLVLALFFSSGGAQIFPGLNLNWSFSLPFVGVDPSVIALAIVLIVLIIAIFWVVK